MKAKKRRRLVVVSLLLLLFFSAAHSHFFTPLPIFIWLIFLTGCVHEGQPPDAAVGMLETTVSVHVKYCNND